MIDPILSLSFSMHSNKGVYALLLGSGVSRSAGIPTGWEITIDLIKKLAVLKKQNCEPDPENWYLKNFDEEPNYSKLLEAVAKSKSERQKLLRSYFEPNEEERENGLKIPTLGHKAIAKLVAGGYVRVIITTNFDRLIEDALREEHIVPNILSTIDSIKGATPLIHSACTVVKVHGDYLDTRIKNTPAELGKYRKELNNLLNRIFDEFGLIVCGWSAEWDTALRDALNRCRTRRFTTYWTLINNPTQLADDLIKNRNAEVINIKGADSFFHDLIEKIDALDKIGSPHPLSAKVAVATLEKYLSDDHHRISLNNFFNKEVERLYQLLLEENYSLGFPEPNKEEFLKRITRYEADIENLLHLLITGCRWSGEKYETLWINCIDRIGNSPDRGQQREIDLWINYRQYPTILLLYGGGISAISINDYKTWYALLSKPVYRSKGDELNTYRIINTKRLQTDKSDIWLFEEVTKSRKTSINEHIYNFLRYYFSKYIPQDDVYEKYFDRFELLLALYIIDDIVKFGGPKEYIPLGRFAKNIFPLHQNVIEFINELYSEAESEGHNWPPFKAGFLDRSLDRLKKIIDVYIDYIDNEKNRVFYD